MTPATTRLYRASTIGAENFGDDWGVTSGSKVDAVNDPGGESIFTTSTNLAVTMLSDVGTVEEPGVKFDPVHFALTEEIQEFQHWYDLDSNGNEWDLDMFNPIQMYCADNTIKILQSFKFESQRRAYPVWTIQRVGFKVWANLVDGVVSVYELKKALQYVA